MLENVNELGRKSELLLVSWLVVFMLIITIQKRVHVAIKEKRVSREPFLDRGVSRTDGWMDGWCNALPTFTEIA